MLSESLNLGVDSGVSAENTLQSNGPSVPLQSSEDQCVDLGLNISSGLGVGECTIGSGLVETVQIGDLSSTLRGGCVTQKTENRIHDSIRVIQVQAGANTGEELGVGLFLGNLSAHLGGSSRGKAEEGEENGGGFVLHDCGCVESD